MEGFVPRFANPELTEASSSKRACNVLVVKFGHPFLHNLITSVLQWFHGKIAQLGPIGLLQPLSADKIPSASKTKSG